MVDFLGWGEPAFFIAQFTQRMLRYVPGSHFAPCRAVPGGDGGVAVVFLIPGVFFPAVSLAEPSVGKLGVTRVRAGVSGLPRHQASPPSTSESPRD